MKDDEIIDLYFNRDETAIKETENKYGNYCFVIANNILSNNEDSRECLNDTWLTTWNKIPPTRPYIFSAFLAKITRNISLTKYKANHADKRNGNEVDLCYEELEMCCSDNNTIDKIDEEQLKDSINSLLALCNETDRKIFVMRYFSFYTVEEIAAYYGFGISKVKMSLLRTRKKLKDFLEKEGYEI